jgi:hypothetical protein
VVAADRLAAPFDGGETLAVPGVGDSAVDRGLVGADDEAFFEEAFASIDIGYPAAELGCLPESNPKSP